MTEPPTAVNRCLAAFHQALAGKVFCIDGVLWRTVGTSTVMTVPAAKPYPIGRKEVDRALRESGCFFAQFATPAQTGVVCKHSVLRDKGYSEQSLQRQFRQTLHRGDQRLSVRSLTWDEVTAWAPHVVDASRSRQGIHIPVNRDLWTKACEAGRTTSRLSAFGCHDGDVLVGFSLFMQDLNGYRAIHTSVRPDSFPHGAANMLLYRSARLVIQRPDCDFVSFGHSGLPELPTVSRFKRHAGLVEEPLNLAVVLHPRLRWLLRMKTVTQGLSWVRAALRPGSRLARPWEGLAAAVATDLSLLPD